jgi:rRNA maturation protein Nop10
MRDIEYQKLMSVQCQKCARFTNVFYLYCPMCGKKLPLTPQERFELRQKLKEIRLRLKPTVHKFYNAEVKFGTGTGKQSS